MPQSHNFERKRYPTSTIYSYDSEYGNLISTRTSTDTSEWEVYNVDYRSFSGTRVANYRTLRSSQGWLPTTNCTDSVIRVTPVTVRQTKYANIWTTKAGYQRRLMEERTVSHCLQPQYLTSDALLNALRNEAWSKVRRKVLDQDFNAPVFLAEAGKSVDLIYGRAQSLARAYAAFRKGRPKQVLRHLGIKSRESQRHGSGAAGNWLEYKYGWMPILMDIHGAAKTLAKLQVKRDIHTFRSSAKHVRTANGENAPRHYGVVVSEAKAWVTVRVKSPNTRAANQVGALNPLVVAWELIPFSFVADWFVNIGDCLSELSAWNGVTILTGGSSTGYSFTGSLTDTPGGWTTGLKQSIAHRRNYSRSSTVQTMPRLQVKSDPLNLEKIVTAASLLRVVTGSKGSLPKDDPVRKNPSFRGLIPEGYWKF